MEEFKKDVEEAKETIKQGGLVKTFLSFDKMITPTLIKVIFYIGIIVSFLSGIGMIISGTKAYFGGGVQVIMGILVCLISPVIVRVYCELLMVIFKIHESLVEIKNK